MMAVTVPVGRADMDLGVPRPLGAPYDQSCIEEIRSGVTVIYSGLITSIVSGLPVAQLPPSMEQVFHTMEELFFHGGYFKNAAYQFTNNETNRQKNVASAVFSSLTGEVRVRLDDAMPDHRSLQSVVKAELWISP
jgi:hypothetical protein